MTDYYRYDLEGGLYSTSGIGPKHQVLKAIREYLRDLPVGRSLKVKVEQAEVGRPGAGEGWTFSSLEEATQKAPSLIRLCPLSVSFRVIESEESTSTEP